MEVATRIALWGVLGGWLGGLGLFAAVVAPTAFATLPSADAAGRVVGPVLTALNHYGAGAGLVLAALAWRLGRGRIAVGLPLLLAGIALASEFVVTAQIQQVLPHELGPRSGPDAAARFAFLHQLSRALFALVLAGVAALVGLHAWADSPPRGAPQCAQNLHEGP